MDQFAVEHDLKHPATRLDQLDFGRWQLLPNSCRQTGSAIAIASLIAVFDGDQHGNLLDLCLGLVGAGYSPAPQNLQCVASTSCPSALHSGQACVDTLRLKACDISTVTIPVGTAMIA